MRLLSISFFGVVGVLFRYYLGVWFSKVIPTSFPYGTFIINILGAFFIGVVYVLATERTAIPMELRLGLMIGLLGGFTTFSSYCLEIARLIEESEYWYAALYFGLSNFVGLLATFSGLLLTRFIFKGQNVL